MKVEDIVNHLQSMEVEELRRINAILVHLINQKTRVKSMLDATKFHTGQRVLFNHKGRTIYGVISKINTRTVLLSEETTPPSARPLKWKVDISLLKTQ